MTASLPRLQLANYCLSNWVLKPIFQHFIVRYRVLLIRLLEARGYTVSHQGSDDSDAATLSISPCGLIQLTTPDIDTSGGAWVPHSPISSGTLKAQRDAIQLHPFRKISLLMTFFVKDSSSNITLSFATKSVGRKYGRDKYEHIRKRYLHFDLCRSSLDAGSETCVESVSRRFMC